MSDTQTTQAKRLVRIKTQLGDNALIVERFTAVERMSEEFDYRVIAMSEKHHELTPKDLVGTNATIVLVQEDNSLRYFNGYVAQLERVGRVRAGEFTRYELAVRPWLHLLSLGNDYRIFQKKTLKEVLTEVFKPYKATDMVHYTIDLSGTHEARRFCVQYNESDLNFVKRICQREGVAYYFTHENGKHTLHFVDKAEALKMVKTTYQPKGFSSDTIPLQSHSYAHDHLNSWQSQGQLVSGKHEVRSYNYKTSQTSLTTQAEANGDLGEIELAKKLEFYSYSEDYNTTRGGTANSQSQLASTSAQHRLMVGTGNMRYVQVGQHFKLDLPAGGEFPDKGKLFTVIGTTLEADDTIGSMRCLVQAIPHGELIAPFGNVTRIPGLQTAVVTGTKGEEIETDEFGRIKVQFHWDRLGQRDENTTCYLRVMQSFAGPGFGGHFTPRIGQEVVVAFENGNPERPFVIGALYHDQHTPPYAGKPTQSGIKTRSTKKGGPDNCNEIRFDDKINSEEFFIQAEKDFNGIIKHNETRNIGNNQSLSIKQDKTEKVGNNDSLDVGKTLTIQAGQKITLKVGGSTIEITGSGIDIKSSSVTINGGSVKVN